MRQLVERDVPPAAVQQPQQRRQRQQDSQRHEPQHLPRLVQPARPSQRTHSQPQRQHRQPGQHEVDQQPVRRGLSRSPAVDDVRDAVLQCIGALVAESDTAVGHHRDAVPGRSQHLPGRGGEPDPVVPQPSLRVGLPAHAVLRCELLLGGKPLRHVRGRGDHTVGTCYEPIRLGQGHRKPIGVAITAPVVRRQVTRSHVDRHRLPHPQRLEDVRPQVGAELLAGRQLDQPRGQVVVRVGVPELAVGHGRAQDLPGPFHRPLRRVGLRQALLRQRAVADPRLVREQLTRRDARVEHRPIEVDLARVRELADRQRRERLADRRDRHLRVPGDRLTGRVVPEALDRDHLVPLGDRHRDTGKGRVSHESRDEQCERCTRDVHGRERKDHRQAKPDPKDRADPRRKSGVRSHQADQ